MQKELQNLKTKALKIFQDFATLVPHLKNLQNDYFTKEQKVLEKIEKIKRDKELYLQEVKKLENSKEKNKKQHLLDFKNSYLLELEELNDELSDLKKANFTYLDDFQELDNEIKKLKNSEYVLAVVGTMKAGKSTVINAIIGSEILPNRADPMTVLPTLITHNSKNIEAKLFLAKSEVLNKILKEIKEKISKSKVDASLNSFLKSKAGKDLLSHFSKNFTFKSEYGKEELVQALTIFNDLIRLSIKLGLKDYINEFKDIDELPRIEVNFSSLSKEDFLKDTKFSLLDTAGANEASLHEELEEIFKSQLKRASGIALIIDSTNIGSKSSQEIQEEFKKVSSYIGKNDSFILANKFDLRTYKDGDSEQMKEDIKNDFEIEDEDFIKKHIFAISAKNAFYANLALNEIRNFGELRLDRNEKEILGLSLFGRRWESEIEKLDLVEEEAQALLQESNFDLAIKNVISNTYKNSYKKTILNPLNKLKNIITKSQNSQLSILQKLDLNKMFYLKSKEELEKDICFLHEKIEVIKINTKWIEEEIINKNSLESLFAYLKRVSENELEKSSSDFIKNFQAAKKDDIKYNKFLNSDQAKEFSSKEEAEEFLKPFIDSLNSELAEKIFHYEIIASSQIEKFCKDFNSALKEKLEKILDESNAHLSQDEKILDLHNFEIALEKKKIDNLNILKSKNITEKEAGAIAFLKRKIGTYLNPYYKNSWGFKESQHYILTLNKLQARIKQVINQEFSLIQKQVLAKKSYILQQMQNSLKSINTKIAFCYKDMQNALQEKNTLSFNSEEKLKDLDKLKKDFLKIAKEIEKLKKSL